MAEDELVCCVCGITDTERDKKPAPKGNYANDYIMRMAKSFRICLKTEQPYCPECHKEKQLQETFDAMDKYEEKHGEQALKKLFKTRVDA